MVESSVPEYFTLSNGQKIPSVGYGTFLNTEGIKDLVKEAVEKGYRHIDTASLYGNEEQIGDALQELFTAGKVKREDLFITTKIFNTDKKEGNVEAALRASLGRLKLDYVDMYLIHWPLGWAGEGKLKQTPLYKTWAELEACVDKGLTKGIGVSNFVVQILLDLLTYARIPPAINQVEMNPYLQQSDLLMVCKRFNILIEEYAPLGALGNVQALGTKTEIKNTLEDPVLIDIAKNHGKTPAQVMLNWAIGRGCVVLPKTGSPARLEGNLKVCDFKLTEEEMGKIAELNRDQRVYQPKNWSGSFPFDNLPMFA